MKIDNLKINDFLKYVEKFLYSENIFLADNYKAIVTEILSNLSIYIRSKNLIEDLDKNNFLSEDLQTNEDIIDSILYENNEELLHSVIYYSIAKNLSINSTIKKRNANVKDTLGPIANEKINVLSPADGISFIKDKFNNLELIISYASTSFESKKDGILEKEIKDALKLLKNNEKIEYLKYVETFNQKEIQKFIKNNFTKLSFFDMLISIVKRKKEFNENFIKPLILKKSLILNNKKTTKENFIKYLNKYYKFNNNSFSKKLKISINDTQFNTKEMLKLLLLTKKAFQEKILDSLILENIQTNTSIVFNYKKIQKLKELFENQLENKIDTFINEEQQELIKTSLTESILKNNKYKKHFNLNAELKINDNLKNKELIDIIIKKSKGENFNTLSNNYFIKVFNHLIKTKTLIDVENIFTIDTQKTDEKYIQIIKDIFYFDKKQELIDLVIIDKFINEMYQMNKNENSKYIINKISEIFVNKINFILKDIKLNPKNYDFTIKELFETISNNEEIYYLDMTSKTFKLSQVKKYDNINEIIKAIENEPFLQALNVTDKIFSSTTSIEEVQKYYFKELIDKNINLNEIELNKMTQNFVDKTFSGSVQKAVQNIYVDTIIEKYFGNTLKEYQKRIKEFSKLKTNKIKHIVMIVDYDNDGTISKLIAESLKKELLKQLGKGYENSNNVHIVYTNNLNNTRGLSFGDYQNVVKDFDPDFKHEILLMTADNATSNIKEINKIINQPVFNYNNKKIDISINNILINDHHPMLKNEENEIKDFYIKNKDKVLLFNPEYYYFENKGKLELRRSKEKNISGAASLYHALKFIIPTKAKQEYIEELAKHSNIMDYVNTEYAEFSNTAKVNESMKIAKNINLFQKYTLYFKEILRNLDLNKIEITNEEMKKIEIYKGEEKFYQYNLLARKKISKLINDSFNEPISTIGKLFINNFTLETPYLFDLLKKNSNRKELLYNLFEDIKELQIEYLESIFKNPENINKQDRQSLIKLKEMYFDGTFDFILKDLKITFDDIINNNKINKNFNIEIIKKTDKNGNNFTIYLDKSLPSIPRKLIMDIVRKDANSNEGIVLYGKIEDGYFKGSARTNGNYVLTDFSINDIKPNFAGHDKAAGVEISENDIEKIRNIKTPVLNIKSDNTLVQYIKLNDIFDFEKILPSASKTNNKKTGGLNFKYIININDIKETTLSLEKLAHIKIKYLNKSKYKKLIKNNKNYSILIDFDSGLKLNFSGFQLNFLADLLDKKKDFNLEFDFFNNTYMLKNINTNTKLDNLFEYKNNEKINKKDLYEYIQTIEKIKNKPEKNEYIKADVIKDSNILYYQIDIDKIKKSKKRNMNDLIFLKDFEKVLKSFGLFEGHRTSIKNFKSHIEKLEEYYNMLYKSTGKINFLITDTETNGLQSQLTQVGIFTLKGKIVNGNWQFDKTDFITTLIKYDEAIGIIPAIEKLTKMDSDSCYNYGTDFNKFGEKLLKILPEAKQSCFIAHNLPFDAGILSKNSNKNFQKYVNDCGKFDTVRLSKTLNTAGSYQFMTKLFLEDLNGNQIYLGLVPENLNVINGKITSLKNDNLKMGTFVTIKGDKISFQGNSVYIYKKNGTVERLTGYLVPKEGHDTKLSSVSQNIYNIFLQEAKEFLKLEYNKNDINIEKELYDNIIDYFNNEILYNFQINFEKSKKVSKIEVINIIKKHFIDPHYQTTLLLTIKQRKQIVSKILQDIELNKALTRLVDKSLYKNIFLDIYKNNKLLDIQKVNKLFEPNGFYEKLQKDLKNIKIKPNKKTQMFLKLLELIKNEKNDEEKVKLYNKSIFILSKIDKTTVITYKKFIDFINSSMSLKNMMNKIFDKNENLKIVYSNARQQKLFLKLFIENLNKINEIFFNKPYDKQLIRNYIKQNKDFLEFDALPMKEKIALFQSFLKLNENPYFKLTTEEAHSNFNAFGDNSLEGTVLPIHYLKYLKKQNEPVKLLEDIHIKSNLTDITSQLRKSAFNTATSQLLFLLNIKNNNLTIFNKKINILLKVDKYYIKKEFSLEDIKKLFPTKYEEIKKIILKYNKSKSKEEKELLKDELYLMFLSDNNIDISLEKQYSDIKKDITVMEHINKQFNDIQILNKIVNMKEITNSNIIENGFYDILKYYGEKYLKSNEDEIDFEISNDDIKELKRKFPFIEDMKINVLYNKNKNMITLKNKNFIYKNFTISKSKIKRMVKTINNIENINNEKLFFYNKNKKIDVLQNQLNDMLLNIMLLNDYVKNKINVNEIKKDNTKTIVLQLLEKVKKLENQPKLIDGFIIKTVSLILNNKEIFLNSENIIFNKKFKEITGFDIKELKNIDDIKLSSDDSEFQKKLLEELKNRNDKFIPVRNEIGKKNKKPTKMIEAIMR